MDKGILGRWLGLLFLFLAGCILTATYACAPVYVPNTLNVPLLGGKGQANIAGTAGVSGFDLQGAYAFSNRLAGMFNLSYLGKGQDSFNNHFFLEGAAGYYHKLGNSGRLECFAGYGWGQAEATTNDDTLHPSSNYHRFFIQPSIGTVSKYFDGAFSVRVAYVNFYNTKHFSGQSKLFFEPVLTGKVGYKCLRFICQIGLSLPTSKVIELEDSFEPLIFNLGLQYSFRKTR